MSGPHYNAGSTWHMPCHVRFPTKSNASPLLDNWTVACQTPVRILFTLSTVHHKSVYGVFGLQDAPRCWRGKFLKYKEHKKHMNSMLAAIGACKDRCPPKVFFL